MQGVAQVVVAPPPVLLVGRDCLLRVVARRFLGLCRHAAYVAAHGRQSALHHLEMAPALLVVADQAAPQAAAVELFVAVLVAVGMVPQIDSAQI